MSQNFEFNISDIKNISAEEKVIRQESLNFFNQKGFPSSRLEEWKFTDLNKIIKENFKDLSSKNLPGKNIKFDRIKNFEHNSIELVNGALISSNFDFEEKKNINILNYKENKNINNNNINSLIDLNNALFEGGYSLEVMNGYELKKPLIVYNYFTGDLKNKIINNKNLIKLHENTKVCLIEYNIDDSNHSFVKNTFDKISISKNASYVNYVIQANKSKSFFYKFTESSLQEKSYYKKYVFSSGLRFNKLEEKVDLKGKFSNCNIQSALFLSSDEHQEIKTRINHLQPDCESYQNIKNVLSHNSRGVYQGKIFVEDVAQKTNAYQLSKALILDETSEFDAKPELEIYADDVKCSHGSTSGSIDKDAIFYLMTRGISKKKATNLLIKGFLFDISDSILNVEIKNLVEKILEKQIYEN